MEDLWMSDSEWIWLSEWNEIDNAHTKLVYFRKNFEVNNKAKKAIVKVSADSRYRLYVNGVSVSFGPCKGDRYVWYYDEIDITSYLKEGENVLAAVVLRYPTNNGEGNYSIWRTDIPGFYLKGTFELQGGNEIFITSDSSWKVMKSEDTLFLAEGEMSYLWIKEQASCTICPEEYLG